MIEQTTLDIPQIEKGLETGLGKVNFVEKIPENLRLRTSVCGIASVAIAKHLARKNISSELILSSPGFSFDRTMSHVFVRTEIEGRVTMIDPTYSQFLNYVGLGHAYVYYTGHNPYPVEKIAVTNSEHIEPIIDVLGHSISRFRSFKQSIDSPLLSHVGHGPLEKEPIEKVTESYRNIWAGRRESLYIPSSEVKSIGRMLANSIEDASVAV